MLYDMLFLLMTFLFRILFFKQEQTLICPNFSASFQAFSQSSMHIIIVNKQNACIFAYSAYTLLCTMLHGYA